MFEGDFWSPTVSRTPFNFCCAYLQHPLFNVYSSFHFTSEPILWHLLDIDLPWFPFWNYIFQCAKNNKHSKCIASNCDMYLELICEQLMQKTFMLILVRVTHLQSWKEIFYFSIDQVFTLHELVCNAFAATFWYQRVFCLSLL